MVRICHLVIMLLVIGSVHSMDQHRKALQVFKQYVENKNVYILADELLEMTRCPKELEGMITGVVQSDEHSHSSIHYHVHYYLGNNEKISAIAIYPYATKNGRDTCNVHYVPARARQSNMAKL